MASDITTDIPCEGQGALHRRGLLRFRLAAFLLGRIVAGSRVAVGCEATGQRVSVGRGGAESRFAIAVRDPETLWQLVTNPDPGAGELYMEGRWDMEEGDIGAFITMLARNLQRVLDGPAGFALAPVLRKRLQARTRGLAESKSYISSHYDIGNDLYELFLDSGMNYSCAFFEGRNISLRDAQLNKIRTTLRRLGVRPGMKVLDIGCGWGEACRVAAAETGAAEVTGVTLAENQLAVAVQRVAGMENAPSYLLEDYRRHAETHEGHYDRIFSIGMFEHVGEDQYGTYFAAIRRQLAEGGRALVHSISNAAMKPGQSLNSPWLEKYIFPGGRIPDLPEMIAAARREGLELAHAPYLQPSADYAETLRRWRANFLLNAYKLDPAKYDERFRRMWVYYLAMCEAMFDGCGFQVCQLVLRRA